jgi:aspartyl-tRNA(Asn)/glutamyl-tRNA(Gln) amidotransferase subunit A
MRDEIWRLSISEIARLLRSREVSSTHLVEYAIARHSLFDSELNAYRSFVPDLARASAKVADQYFAARRDTGLLQGIPVSIKDLYGVTGLPTFAGTKRRLPPEWEVDGPLVKSLRDQCSVFVGKTHTVEFALGGLGTNAHYGCPRNPWDATVKRISGGSSSGAGVSILEGSALVALGSDTAGSVRMPASMTGTVGFRATPKRWSTEGILPVASDLDAPGLLTRSVADLTFAFLALDGSGPRQYNKVGWLAGRPLQTYRIGVAESFFWSDCSAGVAENVRSALAELESRSATLSDLRLPDPESAFQMFCDGHLATASVYSLIKHEFPEWLDLLDPNIRDRLERYGATLPAHEHIRRWRTIQTWQRQAAVALSNVDVLALPTVPTTPAPAADVSSPDEYKRANLAASRNTAVLSLYGLPGISVPVGLDHEGMPVGLQFVGSAGDDEKLINVAFSAEKVWGAAPHRLGMPPLFKNRAS